MGWQFFNLTPGTTVDNLRPIVPGKHPTPHNHHNAFVLWYRGRYHSYTDWSTEIAGLR